MSRSVVEESFKFNRSVIINDSRESALLLGRDSLRQLDLRAIACIPLRRFQMAENMDATMMLKRDVIGVLYVDSHVDGDGLTQTSLRLLESLAFEATKSLENVRLMHEEEEKKQLEQELGMARQVQLALLPTAFKQPEHFEVAAHNIPSRQVGGDFYDLIPLQDGRSVIALGDVSGKGVAAALLAALAQGGLETQFASNLPLTDVITNLNKMLVQRLETNRFITLFCAVLDREGHFTYINAGHNPPVPGTDERGARNALDQIGAARRVRLCGIQTIANAPRAGRHRRHLHRWRDRSRQPHERNVRRRAA